ncbi:unnamed protein product [Oikopleura dioica]|uniref:Rhodanese domain-containing protein n=1 Tax=Oikopleura dioica TaxID=34765 RepID=E4XSV5_OIKDI|nr:unnamed protein product [Oikopleura dioica]CBY32832.1 unnamed protein product [Oikopleura dioica]
MGNNSTLPQISTAEVQSKLNNPEILFVDVRGPSELSAGKLDAKKFLNIPHTEIANEFNRSDDDFKNLYKLEKPKKGAEIVIYCQRGRRGSIAQNALAELGYEKVLNWENGYSSL